MKQATRSVLRKLGTDLSLDAEREAGLAREVDDAQQRQRRHTGDSRDDSGLSAVPEELLTESEKRHEGYRRRQAMGGKFPPAAERLPIMTSEERQERDKSRPKWRATSFEGPIEKLLDKYGPDLNEVERHLTLGQSMKYEFIDGKVLDREGNVIYEGGALTGSSS